MRGAGDHFSVGDRIAFYRRRRGLTQRVLAELVGRSEDWLSKVERNERDVRRLDVISDVARALRVSVGDLLGQPVLVEDTQPKNDDVPAVRDALMSHRRLSQTLFGSRAVEAVAVEPVVRFYPACLDRLPARPSRPRHRGITELDQECAGVGGNQPGRRSATADRVSADSSSGRDDTGEDR